MVESPLNPYKTPYHNIRAEGLAASHVQTKPLHAAKKGQRQEPHQFHPMAETKELKIGLCALKTCSYYD